MSTFRTPVGPQPSSVYWRRRLVVGGGLLLVLIIILLIVFSPKGGGEKDPVSKPTSSPSNSASGLDGLEVQPCNPDAITLEAITDSTEYPAQQQPLISMKITNLGAAACTINVGTDAQEYRITSGSDDIWNSRDCQTAPAEQPITLEPGVDNAQSTTPFPWDRTRSSTDTCDTTRTEVAAGGGTYKLSVLLGDIESAESKAFLLY